MLQAGTCIGSMNMELLNEPVLFVLILVAMAVVSRNTLGHRHAGVRRDILEFVEDGRLPNQLPRLFSLIKNESSRIELD